MAIDPESRLRDSPEEQAGVSLPSPINARLDSLVDSANAAGENTTRKEVVAALLLDAPSDSQALTDAIRRYRVAAASEAVPAGVPALDILGARDRKPGPRPRRAPSG